MSEVYRVGTCSTLASAHRSLFGTNPLAVPKDEDVVYQPTEVIPISDELKTLREVVESLEKKCDGGVK